MKNVIHNISSEDLEKSINEMVNDLEIGKKTKRLCFYRLIEIGYWCFKVLFCFRRFPEKP